MGDKHQPEPGAGAGTDRPLALAARTMPEADWRKVIQAPLPGSDWAAKRLMVTAVGLAQALAVPRDGCEVRHAAAIAGLATAVAVRLAGDFARAEVLAAGDRPRFAHPLIRWPGHSTSRPAAAPGRWPHGPATSSGPPTSARGVRGVPGWTR